jgi:hypothetical protein
MKWTTIKLNVKQVVAKVNSKSIIAKEAFNKAEKLIGAAKEHGLFVTYNDRSYANIKAILATSYSAVQDALSVLFDKSMDDVISSFESLTVDINTTLSDRVNATDDFDGTAGVDDDQVASVTKSIIDMVYSSNILTFLLSLGYNFEDTTVANESITAMHANYFAEDYAAEDYNGNPLTLL